MDEVAVKLVESKEDDVVVLKGARVVVCTGLSMN